MTASGSSVPEGSARSGVALWVLSIGIILGTVLLLALGTWQVHRLSWKLDLIARVDARVHATPKPPPGRAEWPRVTASADEYRHVRLTGTFLNDRETLVQAVTALGPGFWVLTPLQMADGGIVLINRGFVPPERRDPASRAAGQITAETTVTGLLRLTEPNGGFLRSNDPAGNRWFSRDVAAIAAARGLRDTAPYFVDADAAALPEALPVGGLTVIRFPNNHLVYALTWYSLATMLAGGGVWIARDEWRRRHQIGAPGQWRSGRSGPAASVN
ncbi:SURF1 family protein [Lichenifustis flavocetrariae]|uniref:SURF1-like protein n=1 Tax=Lichenifustis flavocetrariae TaxID=2949735 RepID=A0AA41YZB0_9HYPH|nr:SURF1 family protein [Lichenifustis flavocetrariae]MCW6507585.1 SURF1 family protein [Lichenifustis flavocetrariae]